MYSVVVLPENIVQVVVSDSGVIQRSAGGFAPDSESYDHVGFVDT